MLDEALLTNAKRFLPENVAKLILNLQLTAHWIDDSHFYYLEQIENGHQFILVDITKAQKEFAFDHKKLATKLNCHAHNLPFKDFDFIDDKHIHFVIEGEDWSVNLSTYDCNKIDNYPIAYPSQAPSAMQAWGMLPCVETDTLRSPDGHYDLTIQEFNLMLTDVTTGKTKALTTDGEQYYDYASSPECNLTTITNIRLNKIMPPIAIWSNDSTKILTHKLDQRLVKPLYFLQNSPQDGTFRPKLWQQRIAFAGDEQITTNELVILDIKHNKTIAIKTPPIQTTMIGSTIESNYAWFNDDASLVFFIREYRGNKKIDFCVADTTTGDVKVLLTEQSPCYVETSHLLFWLNYTKTLNHTHEAVWLSERDGFMQIYLVDTEKGGIKHAVTSGQFFVRSILHVDEKIRWVYFLASGKENNIDPYYRILYRAHLDNKIIERLTPEDADHTIAFSPDKNYFITNFSTLDTIPEAKLYHADGRQIMSLTKANFDRLFALGWKMPEPFTMKADDGVTDLYGVIYRPSHFDENKNYPIIDDMYPGPQVLHTPKTYHYDPPDTIFGPWWSQCYAELGFIVINVEGRGTPLRHREFHHFSHNNMESAGGLTDHIHVIKALQKKYQYMDSSRVGIVGWSQGGYAAARAILAFPEFYKVAISFAGDHELRSYLAYWGEKVQQLNDDEAFERYANRHLAHQLKGKLYLIHGELDDNVHMAGTMQLVDTLIKADKDFDMLILPNENHGAYFTNAYLWRKMWEYFVTHL